MLPCVAVCCSVLQCVAVFLKDLSLIGPFSEMRQANDICHTCEFVVSTVSDIKICTYGGGVRELACILVCLNTYIDVYMLIHI